MEARLKVINIPDGFCVLDIVEGSVPRHKEKSSVYSERVVDYREVTKDGNVKCKNCAHGSYYNVVKA